MANSWKDQPRGQPANAGQFGSKPKVQASTPQAPDVDLGGQVQQGAADPHQAARQAIIDSLPEDSATVIYSTQDADPFSWPAGTLTSEGGCIPLPEGDRGRAAANVLSLCERAFSSRAWGEYLSEQGDLHAAAYRASPSESACADMADMCMALLTEDPDLLGEPPSLNAQRTMPSGMPVTTGNSHQGLRWMPSPNTEPPEAGVVYWSVGRLEDHDDRTQDVLNPEERRTRTGYPSTVYEDNNHEYRALYLRMMSFDGYDDKRGHLKGHTETLVRYTMPDEAAITEHIMAGYRKERERRIVAGR